MNLQPSGCINLIHSLVCIHTCRDTEELKEEEQEEVTGSLLRGGGGGGDSSYQEEEVCPPLLPVSPSLHRAQSFLHGINLRVQQVG